MCLEDAGLASGPRLFGIFLLVRLVVFFCHVDVLNCRARVNSRLREALRIELEIRRRVQRDASQCAGRSRGRHVDIEVATGTDYLNVWDY